MRSLSRHFFLLKTYIGRRSIDKRNFDRSVRLMTAAHRNLNAAGFSGQHLQTVGDPR
jgi:hypothetical protein